jgi:chitinase
MGEQIMKIRICLILFLIFGFGGVFPGIQPIRASGTFCAYFVEWGVYARDYVVADIPADKLTHVNYAFIEPADIDSDTFFECRIIDTWAALEKPMQRLVPGTDPLEGEHLGNLNQFAVLRRNHSHLRLMMSLGGWTLSGHFPVIASTEAQRTHFAEYCVQFMQDHGFDGIDIDWEYPGPADRDNFTLLLQTFREKLDDLSSSTGIDYPLTIAAPAGPAHIANIDLPAIEPHIDFINLMAYDLNGIWSSTTGYNAPLYTSPDDPMGPSWNADAAVQAYLAGLPPDKINLGLAYYGRGFDNLLDGGPNPVYPGRYAGVNPGSPVQGTWDDSGVFDYWDLAARFTGPFEASTDPLPVLDGYTRYWDMEQVATYVYHPDAIGQSGHYWLGYDDPQSLSEKVEYALLLNLGGVFIWELSQEGLPGTQQYPLTDAVHAALTAQSCLHHGDVNFDGHMTALDAQSAFLIALGIYSPSEDEACAADCNGDGTVTAGDAQMIFYAALGSGECIDEIPV